MDVTGGRACRAAIAAACALSTLALAADGAQARGAKLTVQVTGLPQWAQPAVRIAGPHGFRKPVRSARVTFRGLRRGRYVVRVAQVRFDRADGPIQLGAIAYPAQRKRTVQIRRGRARTVKVRYGATVNPGTATLRGRVLSVSGAAADPQAIRVEPVDNVPVGTVLTAGPSTALPNGLFHRVTGATPATGGVQLTLAPASVAQVVPMLSYRAPQGRASAAAASPKGLIRPRCGLEGTAEIAPSLQVDDFRPDAVNLVAAPWNGGPRADLTVTFRTTLGLDLTAQADVTCELKIDRFTAVTVIPAGPALVPLYFQLPVSGRLSVAGGVDTHRQVSFDTTVGMRLRRSGLTVAPHPVFEWSNVAKSSERRDKGSVDVTLSADPELGLGLPDLLNVHGTLSTNLQYTNDGDGCSLDLHFAGLAAAGEVGPFNVSTPQYAAYTKNILTCRHDIRDCEDGAPQVVAREACRGTILRVGKTGSSYFVDRDGRPHWIPDGGTFTCLKSRFKVVTVPQGLVDELGDGKPWQPRCNAIATVSATGTSYYLDGGGAPHWIADAETYHCLTGRGAAVTTGVPQPLIDALGSGQPWQKRCIDAGRVKGKIVKVDATNTAYFVDNAGVPHWIRDGGTFNCLAGRGIPVVGGLAQEQVDGLGNGRPWQPPCNAIATVSATGTSYFIDGSGRPHWIPDAETYHCLTGRGHAAEAGLPQALIDALGDGQPWQPRCVDPNRARGKVLSVAGGPSYYYDGTLHWIPDVETYWCMRGRGAPLLGGLTQAHADSLGGGQPWQPRCIDPNRARGHILQVAGGPSYIYDGTLRWIPGTETYWCWRNRGWKPIEGLTQPQVDTLGNGQPWAPECLDPNRVRRHVVREKGGTAYLVDGGDWWHWIPDGGTYNCLVARYPLVNNVTWGEINSLRRENGVHANCGM